MATAEAAFPIVEPEVDDTPCVGNHKGAVRTCDTTGLPVCLTAQTFIRLNAVMAVVAILVGGVSAILLALTRWPAVHLLPADWF